MHGKTTSRQQGQDAFAVDIEDSAAARIAVSTGVRERLFEKSLIKSEPLNAHNRVWKKALSQHLGGEDFREVCGFYRLAAKVVPFHLRVAIWDYQHGINGTQTR